MKNMAHIFPLLHVLSAFKLMQDTDAAWERCIHVLPYY
jgi:hypothetical protein